MAYADHTRNTKEPLKRFAHGRRLHQAARLVPLHADMKVLDYGCGDGGLFEEIESFTPAENLFGYDPGLLSEMIFDGATVYDDAKSLVADYTDSFDVVYCMEVCEHLNFDATCELFKNIHALTRPEGRVVFGVPIETGLSGFLKNVYRTARGGRQGATIGRAIKSLFGMYIPRACAPRGWIGSHVGFDAKAFSEQLKYGGFEILERHYLPVPQLRGALNNEVYFICTLRTPA